jgi:hypothetical protein
LLLVLLYIKGDSCTLRPKIKGGKNMKKALSLIIAIILTLSIGIIALAVENEELQEPLTEKEAEEIATEFLICDKLSNDTSVTFYSDYKFYTDVPVYEVITRAKLKSGEEVVYTTYVDKFDGRIYYRTAQFSDNIAPLTRKEAIQYAYKVLCINEENTTKITDKISTNDMYETLYQFTFCNTKLVRYDCVINADTGFIDKVSAGSPSNIVERIILLFKLLFANINILDRFEGLTPGFDSGIQNNR